MSAAEDNLRDVLKTPKGERIPDALRPIMGFKGESFFGAGMIVLMRCGPCDGDLCPECEWTGVVLVHLPETTT